MIAGVRGRGRPALFANVILGAAAVACGAAPGASCPRDLPMSCPDPAPSFATEVHAIYEAKCQACHAPGGQEQNKPFTTLAQIQAEPLSTMLSQLYNCVMPLAGSPALTTEERQALLGWLVCLEPNN
jgi:mono/diheme cytochrome c family protein